MVVAKPRDTLIILNKGGVIVRNPSSLSGQHPWPLNTPTFTSSSTYNTKNQTVTAVTREVKSIIPDSFASKAATKKISKCRGLASLRPLDLTMLSINVLDWTIP